MSFGLFLFWMFFMALKESLRITNFVCLVVWVVSMAFRMAIASAENIKHSFGSLNVILVFSSAMAIPTPSFPFEASVQIFWWSLKSSRIL